MSQDGRILLHRSKLKILAVVTQNMNNYSSVSSGKFTFDLTNVESNYWCRFQCDAYCEARGSRRPAGQRGPQPAGGDRAKLRELGEQLRAELVREAYVSRCKLIQVHHPNNFSFWHRRINVIQALGGSPCAEPACGPESSGPGGTVDPSSGCTRPRSNEACRRHRNDP